MRKIERINEGVVTFHDRGICSNHYNELKSCCGDPVSLLEKNKTVFVVTGLSGKNLKMVENFANMVAGWDK